MSLTKPCLQCGKTYALRCPALINRSKFCSRQCANAYLGNQQTVRATTTRECPVCGRAFETTQHHGGKKTCSIECGRASRKRKMAVLPSRKQRRTCPVCGTQFIEWPSRPKHYCSHKCSEIASEGAIRTSTVVTCDHCGKPVKKFRCRYGHYSKHFCSKECYRADDSKFASGSANRAWQGGGPNYYGPHWLEKNRLARERDNYRCQICGSSQETHLQVYAQPLHVHHIISLRQFGEDFGLAHDLDNLVTLCIPCHGKMRSEESDIPLDWGPKT